MNVHNPSAGALLVGIVGDDADEDLLEELDGNAGVRGLAGDREDIISPGLEEDVKRPDCGREQHVRIQEPESHAE